MEDTKERKQIKLGCFGCLGILIILIVIFGALGTPSNAPEVQPTEDTSITEPTPEEAYVDYVRAELGSDTDGLANRDILRVGQDACNTYADGYTTDEITAYLITSGSVDTDDRSIRIAATMIGAAKGILCPQYIDQ